MLKKDHQDPERLFLAGKFFFEYLINTRYYKQLYNHLGNDQAINEQEEQTLCDNFLYI